MLQMCCNMQQNEHEKMQHNSIFSTFSFFIPQIEQIDCLLPKFISFQVQIPIFQNVQHFWQVCCKYAAICSKLKKWEQSTVFPFIAHLKMIINANFHVAKNFFYKVSLYAAICRKMLQMCCKCSIIAFFQKFSFSIPQIQAIGCLLPKFISFWL